MKNTLILIPPSEGKTPGGNGRSLKKASSHIKPMIDALSHVKDSEWGKILGVKGKALEAAVEANTNILTSPTMAAIERYSGVVYKAIDHTSLDQASRKVFDQSVRIVSAVFGLVKPQDMIPDYKLKIDKLGADKYWKSLNAKTLKDVFVIDLLPKAHQKAVEYDNGVVVEFFHLRDGRKISAGHQGKHIKGRFIRWLVQQPALNPECFVQFTDEGYKWNGEAFTKKV